MPHISNQPIYASKNSIFPFADAERVYRQQQEPGPFVGYRFRMEATLCHISAFRYYRIHPQVLGFLPTVTINRDDPKRTFLRSHIAISDCIGDPHILVRSANLHTGARHIRQHRWTKDLPPSCIRKSALGIQVTSPLFTLLQLAGTLDDIQVLMALYEMCGSFSVFKPSAHIKALIAQSTPYRSLIGGSWKRVVDGKGTPSSLWMRPPIVDIEELNEFLDITEGLWGHKRLARAASHLTGVVASPLEAQLSMLLGLPRCRGGEGLKRIETNKAIALSRDARTLHASRKAVIDALITSPDGTHELALECQGRISHGMGGLSDGDANRATALQSMGIDVVLITSEQINQSAKYETLAKLIFSKLDMERRPKTQGQKRAELDLRRKIFSDWSDFGSQFD